MDLTEIVAGLSGVGTAIDITKRIASAGGALEKADLKLQLANIVDSLANSKLASVEVQKLLREKDAEIEALKNAFAFRDETVVVEQLHYQKNDHGKPVGQPFCPRCHEADSKWITMRQKKGSGTIHSWCPQCGTEILATSYGN